MLSFGENENENSPCKLSQTGSFCQAEGQLFWWDLPWDQADLEHLQTT